MIFLFDIGNVVIQADMQITSKLLQEAGVGEEKSKLLFDNMEYNEFSRGNIGQEEFCKALNEKYFDTSLQCDVIAQAHNDHLFAADKDLLSIVSRLPKEQVAFLSDTNVWQTFKERKFVAVKEYGFRVFRSHEIHLLKMDEACFPFVIKELGCDAQDILFVDDSPEKVAMGRRFGLQTILFTGAKDLEKELVSRGFLS